MDKKIFLIEGRTSHCRHFPSDSFHKFDYPVISSRYVLFDDQNDVDDDDDDDRNVVYVGGGVFSICEDDFLRGCDNENYKKKKLIERLFDVIDSQSQIDSQYQIDSQSLSKKVKGVEVITSMRFFGYVFNPVNFFFCYSQDNDLLCLLVEVQNTFGESHCYLLDENNKLQKAAVGYDVSYRTGKRFHVSPFNSIDGEYVFHINDIRKKEKLDIRINLIRENHLVLSTRLYSSPTNGIILPTNWNVIRLLFKYPITALLTVPRIMLEAWKLHYQKYLLVFAKPNPSSSFTIRRVGISSITSQKYVDYFIHYLRHCSHSIKLILPNGKIELIESKNNENDHSDDKIIEIDVVNEDAFERIVKNGSMGFTYSYIHGDLKMKSSDLTLLLSSMMAFAIDLTLKKNDNCCCVNEYKASKSIPFSITSTFSSILMFLFEYILKIVSLFFFNNNGNQKKIEVNDGNDDNDGKMMREIIDGIPFPLFRCSFYDNGNDDLDLGCLFPHYLSGDDDNGGNYQQETEKKVELILKFAKFVNNPYAERINYQIAVDKYCAPLFPKIQPRKSSSNLSNLNNSNRHNNRDSKETVVHKLEFWKEKLSAVIESEITKHRQQLQSYSSFEEQCRAIVYYTCHFQALVQNDLISI